MADNTMPLFYQKLNSIRPKTKQITRNNDYTSMPYSKSMLNSTYNRMQPFFNFVKEICDDNKDVANSELVKYITNMLSRLNFNYANCTSFRSDSIRLDICNYFKNHPLEFKKIYSELTDTEKETGIPVHADQIIKYSSNQEISKRQLMSQLITTYREIKNSFPPEIQSFLKNYARCSTKQKRAFRDAQKTRESKEYIMKNEMFFIDELDGLYKFLVDQTSFFDQELKKDYIESIETMILTLQSLGVTQKYIATNNRLMSESLNIPEFEITPEEFIDTYVHGKNSTSTLSHLDIPTLSALNSFWVNRVTKELSSFSNAFFITNDLNLWDKIRTAPKKQIHPSKVSYDDNDDVFVETKYEVPISEEELSAVLEKIKFLEEETSYYFILASSATENIKDLSENEIVDPYTGTIQKRKSAVYRDLSQEAQILDAQIGKDYHDYFSKVNNGVLSKSNNDFLLDFHLYSTCANITHNSYLIKDNIMISQLSNLFNNPSVSKNWGLSEDVRKKGFNHDMLLISIDMPGLNMPLRLHIRRELLEDFLRANQNTTRMPLYHGAQDFYKGSTKNSGYIPCPVLLPVSTEKKKKVAALAKRIDETHPKYGFIEHINFIENSTNIPQHLKDFLSTKKGNKSRRKFIPRFYDFADGKVYKDIGNNRIVEDPDFLQGGKVNVK